MQTFSQDMVLFWRERWPRKIHQVQSHEFEQAESSVRDGHVARVSHYTRSREMGSHLHEANVADSRAEFPHVLHSSHTGQKGNCDALCFLFSILVRRVSNYARKVRSTISALQISNTGTMVKQKYLSHLS
jgi:hypothetical protein